MQLNYLCPVCGKPRELKIPDGVTTHVVREECYDSDVLFEVVVNTEIEASVMNQNVETSDF